MPADDDEEACLLGNDHRASSLMMARAASDLVETNFGLDCLSDAVVRPGEGQCVATAPNAVERLIIRGDRFKIA
jgi:hypothetical protein